MSLEAPSLYRFGDPAPDIRPPNGNTLTKITFFDAAIASKATSQKPGYTIQRTGPDNLKKTPSPKIHAQIQTYEAIIQASPLQQKFSFDTNENHTSPLLPKTRSYTAQLSLATALPPTERSQTLRTFLSTHDKMMTRLLELRKEVISATRGADRYLEARVRLAYCHFLQRVITVWHGNSTSPHFRRMVYMWELRESLHELAQLLKAETVKALAELRMLEPDEEEDEDEEVVYENVGPDHDVESLGRVVAVSELEDMRAGLENEADRDRDHRLRCIICLDPYTATHQPFQLFACTHLIGQDCMSTWVNSTHRAATTCPYCRTTLCERRARRPADVDAATRIRISDLHWNVNLWLNHYLPIVVKDSVHALDDLDSNGIGVELRTFESDLFAELRANGVRYEVWWDEDDMEFTWHRY